MTVKTVTLADAKANLSKLTDMASQGESVIITKHGKPVAKVCPPDAMLKRANLSAMQALTASQATQAVEAGELIRLMRDGERY